MPTTKQTTQTDPETKPLTRTVCRRSILACTPLTAAVAVMPKTTLGQLQADQQLIETCKRHIRNIGNYNASTFKGDFENDPLWHEYQRTRAAIIDARPHTLAGMAAKARAVIEEATRPDGRVDLDGSVASSWALDLVNDLIRLSGGAA